MHVVYESIDKVNCCARVVTLKNNVLEVVHNNFLTDSPELSNWNNVYPPRHFITCQIKQNSRRMSPIPGFDTKAILCR